ncbi:MAG TPA: hypothetical protein VFA45_12845 [Actinomycetes bacterium]|nr:hypothetical protein [Actinomycetes bacterium]
MNDLAELKDLTPEVGVLIGVDEVLVEAVLQLDRLRSVVADSLDRERLERYVAGLHGRRWQSWRTDYDGFVAAELVAEQRWSEQAKQQLAGDAIAGQLGVQIHLVARELRASLLIDVEEVASRESLVRHAEWWRDACALLTAPAGDRHVGARMISLTVWCPHEDFDRWKLGHGSVTRAAAQALRHAPGRRWLAESGFRVGPKHGDLLVRALKTKLIAVRVATRALDAVNRRLDRG